MADKARDLELLSCLNIFRSTACKGLHDEVTCLNIERRIEAHLQEILVVLVEHAQEALLEDRRSERIRQDNNTIR
jgi:hypothetical protein